MHELIFFRHAMDRIEIFCCSETYIANEVEWSMNSGGCIVLLRHNLGCAIVSLSRGGVFERHRRRLLYERSPGGANEVSGLHVHFTNPRQCR